MAKKKKASASKKVSKYSKAKPKAKKSIVPSSGKGKGRGVGLKRWHMVRSEVKNYLEYSGKEHTTEQLNSYSSLLYRNIKNDFENASNSLDVIVVDFFTEDRRRGEPLPTFNWWLLNEELTMLPTDALIIVDNENGVEGDYYSGDVNTYLLRFSSAFINHMNYKYPRKKDSMPYFLYVVYTKENVTFYKMFSENDPVLNSDDTAFEEWMASQGISLDNMIVKPSKETTVEDIDREIEESIPYVRDKSLKDVLAIEKEKTKQMEIKQSIIKDALSKGYSIDDIMKLVNSL